MHRRVMFEQSTLLQLLLLLLVVLDLGSMGPTWYLASYRLQFRVDLGHGDILVDVSTAHYERGVINAGDERRLWLVKVFSRDGGS